ncbi:MULTISPECIES: dihydroorotase [Pseudoalteromonas]|uniref:dihydroorotase n=1 Tax=Pseudoalteromonas TaxID=53246 RepID=UPI0019D1DAE9|nr:MULTISPECIES: dihydroorotase [Pseudoalteromonas]MBR8843815.1 dihydroorotase [Pseudoalteromonas sp. JC3]QUI71994.1 dihydroorotase [Pseudoalteromonas sp. M8]UDM60673.1 dihydroorotase [Pseudoalteromonas piscicida]WJE08187.1 dihydroorotase [Pseudoalteromonas sp. JC3]
MKNTLIKNAIVVNENQSQVCDVLIVENRINKIASSITAQPNDYIVDATGYFLLPGMIDDQVHFREPGLTQKGNIASESRAAVAGGITSYMEMPNVSPATTTIEALEQKYAIASRSSLANYGFYLGATEDNLEQIKRLDAKKYCGVKVFMGASTGDLLVEHPQALDAIFRESPTLIVTHCEDGRVIEKNLSMCIGRSGSLTIQDHPIIRDAEACYSSSSYAVSLAKQYRSDLHVLHITTEKELSLFPSGDIRDKHITAEACVHHLWFSQEDYALQGNLIKCNPAIKAKSDRDALLAAVRNNQIDIIATDHAPHTWQEKQLPYQQAPAGLPLVEHALLSLLDHVHHQRLSIEQLVEKVAHNPALRYHIVDRGFIREGYYADLVLVNPHHETPTCHQKTHYHCGWTPFDGHRFSAKVLKTWVNGSLVYDGQQPLNTPTAAMPLIFNR